MNFGILGTGLILLALFAVFYWLKIFATLTAILGLVAVVMIGGNGVIGGLLVRLTTWLISVTGHITAWAFGGTVLAIVFIVAAVIYVHDLHPRHKAGRRTHHLGLLIGLLIVAGATGIPALAGASGAIQHGTTSIFSSF